MKWTKKAWNYSTYDVTHKKKTIQENLFSLQTQVFWGFEQLSSAFGARDIHMQTAGFRLKLYRQLTGIKMFEFNFS